MAEQEFPGVSEAALALGEKHHEERRQFLLNLPDEELPEGLSIPAPWNELEQFGRTAVAQSMIPTIMIVAPHITEGVKTAERTKQTVRLFSPDLNKDLQSILPDSIPNQEAVIAAILDKVADALTAE